MEISEQNTFLTCVLMIHCLTRSLGSQFKVNSGGGCESSRLKSVLLEAYSPETTEAGRRVSDHWEFPPWVKNSGKVQRGTVLRTEDYQRDIFQSYSTTPDLSRGLFT